MSKPYVIDAVLGNSRLLATLTGDGILQRLFWPTIDYGQHVYETKAGILVDEAMVWTDESGWKHKQSYVEDNNVLITDSVHSDKRVSICATDFAIIEQDVLVRQYKVKNDGPARPLSFIYASLFHIEDSPLYNSVLFDEKADALVHYRRDTYIGVTGSIECSHFQATGNPADIEAGCPNGTAVGLGSHSGMRWDLGTFESGEMKEITVYIVLDHNYESLQNQMMKTKANAAEVHRCETEAYWKAYLLQGRQIQTSRPDVDKLYRRSLLVFKLMSDATYGGLVAAPEFDPTFSRCGGYAYCWGRDAAYITTAIDKAGYPSLVHQFYQWAVKSQSPDGSWQHRHYMNGMLAPAWGFQADEPASLIWGMWQHYLTTKDVDFLNEMWGSLRAGADFLTAYKNEDTLLPSASVDLWEERTAEHTYSSAAVAAGLFAAAEAAEHRGEAELARRWRDRGEEIRRGMDNLLWNEEKGSFYRGVHLQISETRYRELRDRELPDNHDSVFTKQGLKQYTRYISKFDDVVDASLLGVNVPFALYDSYDKRLRSTAETVERLLTSPVVGGIKRYEDDIYAGGNPWIICSLWLALDAITVGDYEKAHMYLNWSVDHQTPIGLLPEQVDKGTGGPAWVVPLTWSHAMYVLTVLELIDRGQL